MDVEIRETGKHYMKGFLFAGSAQISPSLSEPMPKGSVSGSNKTYNSSVTKLRLTSEENTSLQEKYVILSFLLLTTALIVKLIWTFIKLL